MKGQMTLGISASIMAALLFTVMDVSAKVLAPLGMGEITFIRGLAGLLFIPLIARHEGKPLFSGRDRLLLHLRGLFGGFGILLFFYSLLGMKLGGCGNPGAAFRLLHVHSFTHLPAYPAFCRRDALAGSYCGRCCRGIAGMEL